MIRCIVLIAVLAAPGVWSYSSGAPSKACLNGLRPEHGNEKPQTSSPPYSLSGGSSVKSGQYLELSLSGDLFSGFAIQAQSPNQKRIGTFKVVDQNSKTLNCDGIESVLTHVLLTNPINNVKIQWHAPQSYQGPVTFQATVAKNRETFWIGKIKKDVNVI